MARTKSHGRTSMNSSVLSVTNNSIIEEGQSPVETEYSEFIKRFREPGLEGESRVDLVGCKKSIKDISFEIDHLLGQESGKQNFVLISGPSGTGKTTVVRKLVEQHGPKLQFFFLEASWILEKQFGNPESRIRLIFDEAIKKAPSLIFIDEIDIFCSAKKSQEEQRIFHVFRNCLKLARRLQGKILVLAATNKSEILDPEIRGPRFLRKEIRFNFPTGQDRLEYLSYITSKYGCDLSAEQIVKISDATDYYSFDDLNDLIDDAVCKSKQRNAKHVEYEDLKLALSQYKPVAIKSIVTPYVPLHWDDIGGVQDVKKKLQKSVIWPMTHQEVFQELGLQRCKGALLYGPPGCSKTMLARALATESGYNFISIKGPELNTKWVGDTEAAVRGLYRKARDIAPCIVFFDEIDGFAPKRCDNQSSSVGEKAVTMLLAELDGFGPLDNVFTLAATNRPDRVDPALLREGRLNPTIYIRLPSEEDRREIFRVHMRRLKLDFSGLQFEDAIKTLAKKTPFCSGSEIAKVCRLAGELSLDENPTSGPIEFKHFQEALKMAQPTSASQLKTYNKFEGTKRHKETLLSRLKSNVRKSTK